MANYDTLKATIDAYIRANYTKAITGPILNGILNAMVDSLGTGFQFFGEATPSTDPGRPDQNVFYFATTPGTYTGFGGVILEEGDIVIFKYNEDGWSTYQVGHIPQALADLASDLDHQTVTEAQKRSWTLKQDLLRSGINIKTINGQSLLGAGDIDIQGGGGSAYVVKGTINLSQDTPTVTITEGDFAGIVSAYEAGTPVYAAMDTDDIGTMLFPLAIVAGNIGALFVAVVSDYIVVIIIPSYGSPDANKVAFVHPSDLAEVATSGNYNDLNNRPLIPQPQIQSDWSQTDNTKKDYIKNKPTIPAAQVNADWNAASGVAAILNKPTIPAAQVQSDWNEADNTNPAFIKNKPSIPDELNDLSDVFVAVYGTTTAAEIAAAISAGKVILAQRDGKLAIYEGMASSTYYFYRADTEGVVQITLNAGTGTWSQQVNYHVNSSISRGVSTVLNKDSTGGTVPTSKATYSAIHPSVVTSQPAGGMLPNVLYRLGTLTGSVAIALATPEDANVANHYYFTFETGATAPTITWPAGITAWNGGSAPTINANKHYEVSVLDGIGAFMEV